MTPHNMARDPRRLRQLRADLTARIEALNVTVAYSPLPDHKLGRWTPYTTTLHIRDTADDIDIVWVMHEFWLLHTVGEHACGGHRAPHLTAVS